MMTLAAISFLSCTAARDERNAQEMLYLVAATTEGRELAEFMGEPMEPVAVVAERIRRLDAQIDREC